MSNLNRHIAPPSQNIEKLNIVRSEKIQLDNGIPVYLIHAGTEDIIKIDIIVPAGNWYETAPFIAQATGAMLTEGTSLRNSQQIAAATDHYGAFLQCSVERDHAIVSLVSLNKHLAHTLPIMQDVLQNAIFPENELEILINKRVQRYEIDTNKVKVLSQRAFAEALFGKQHPYGRTATPQDFRQVTQKQLFEHYQRLYKGNKYQMIVSGNITTNTTLLLNKFLGTETLTNTSIDNVQHEVGALKNRELYIEKPQAVQNAIRIGRPLFTRSNTDYIGIKILNTILGGYFGSRLMNNIREDKGYTYGIGSAVISYKNHGYIVIVSEVGSEVYKEAIKEVFVEMDVLKTQPVSAQELNRVKNYMIGDLMNNIDGPFALSANLKELLEHHMDEDFYTQTIEEIKNITPKKIQELAEKYLQRGEFYTVVAGAI